MRLVQRTSHRFVSSAGLPCVRAHRYIRGRTGPAPALAHPASASPPARKRQANGIPGGRRRQQNRRQLCARTHTHASRTCTTLLSPSVPWGAGALPCLAHSRPAPLSACPFVVRRAPSTQTHKHTHPHSHTRGREGTERAGVLTARRALTLALNGYE